MSLIIRSDFNGVTDPDAGAYIAAVENADVQPLEFAVGKAINDFVIGCKNDGIWNAIKASCILAGARTLAGALVPLAGAAPTPFGFLPGDYNRKTGLAGDGSTKYLDSNRNNNADPQNSKHIAVYRTQSETRDVVRCALGLGSGGVGTSQLLSTTTQRIYRVNTSGSPFSADTTTDVGLYAASRSSSSGSTGRYGGVSTFYPDTSATPYAGNLLVFRRSADYSDASLAFYSIGESLNLALLDARVTTLINAFGAAIP